MTNVSEEIAETLRRCNKCGFCLAGCPIYKVTGLEWETARGRIELVRGALLDSKIELEEIEDPLYHCLTCNNCVEHCPAGIKTSEIIFNARAEMLKKQGDNWRQRLLLHKLLASPSLLHRASRLLKFADTVGLRSIARKTGLMKILGDAGKAEAVVTKVPSISGLEEIRRFTKKIDHPKYQVAYFVGCNAANLAPNIAIATIRVLHRHQVEVMVPEFVCCGLPAAGYGDFPSALNLAQKNIARLDELSVDAIVTPCGSCSSFLKDYGKLLNNEPQWAEKARSFASKTKDLSEFLIDIGLNTDMGTISKKITYHDPCHLAHHQKIREQPRAVLKSIPGVEFIEMAEANACCGAAGTYAFKNYDLSMKVLGGKMSNVGKTSADILTSSCPGCILQLAYGVRRENIPLRVLEIVELLDQAYQNAKSG